VPAKCCVVAAHDAHPETGFRTKASPLGEGRARNS
jgi:hypothetical protein